MSLTESKKRDFVSQLIVILEQNSQLLTDKGFDPAAKITQLQTELVNSLKPWPPPKMLPSWPTKRSTQLTPMARPR